MEWLFLGKEERKANKNTKIHPKIIQIFEVLQKAG
jgi:hypothetical protein